MASVKRKCQTEDNDEEQEDLKETSEEKEEVPAKKRRIEFQDVTIYNFNRRQGYTCVPSQVNIFTDDIEIFTDLCQLKYFSLFSFPDECIALRRLGVASASPCLDNFLLFTH